MIIKQVSLDTVIGVTSKIPVMEYPEFAFAGKSNVGKSSLINAMMNRKALARVSAKPGKTQTINYYKINEDLFLVDLPGYGFTTANVETRESWGKMVERYLRESKMLKYVFLLVDCRHEPSANDKQMFDWIVDKGVTPVIIATKIDKLKRSQVEKHLSMIKKAFHLTAENIVLPFSAETKAGVEELWTLIEDLC